MEVPEPQELSRTFTYRYDVPEPGIEVYDQDSSLKVGAARRTHLLSVTVRVQITPSGTRALVTGRGKGWEDRMEEIRPVALPGTPGVEPFADDAIERATRLTG